MTKDEALKLALDAFGEIAWSNETQWQRDRAKEAITAIKKALAQPEQEPVAWAENDGEGNVLWDRESCFSDDPEWLDNPMPLYITPPQRTWVGLTDEEIKDCFKITPDQHLPWHIYQRIEAKLKEKNNA